MKTTGILMCTDMVRAYGEGRKSQTRRTIKDWQNYACLTGDCPHEKQAECDQAMAWLCRYGQAGDELFIKETFALWRGGEHHKSNGAGVTYRADCIMDADAERCRTDYDVHWTPSIFMPAKFSRYQTAIVSIRADRVQDISEADAVAEGVDFLRHVPDFDETLTAKDLYKILWNHINLAPAPVHGRDEAGKKVIDSYASYPWSNADFDLAHPGDRQAGLWRGRPLEVMANPWCYRIEFKPHTKQQ